eukprot:TRINITY_DN54297_c0_g1_i1.p1 TRINITY_DN54297_c0_g1~~TRINITY_DN54297_c0_g1_i1.p1  ORF type:complete len:237 (+),score=63.51 TRINITY_DN54297_c0_g1_i1:59-712(+)
MAPKRPAASGRGSGTAVAAVKAASAGSVAAAKARSAPAPRIWPPKVPMGPMDDVLPMIEQDDDCLDTLMLPSPDMITEADAAAKTTAFGPEEIEYICKCLEKNSSVTQLNVSFNPLGDLGAAHVASLLSASTKLALVRLSLNSCGIGADGACALAEALASHGSVEVVELMNNKIDDRGGEALLAVLNKNKRLKQLMLSFNQVSEELESRIDKALLMR